MNIKPYHERIAEDIAEKISQCLSIMELEGDFDAIQTLANEYLELKAMYEGLCK